MAGLVASLLARRDKCPAFVSKHNPSSAAAVEELGRSFSEVLTAQDLWNVAAPVPRRSSCSLGFQFFRVQDCWCGRCWGWRCESSGCQDFKTLVGDCARWTRENPSVVLDNEDLVPLDKELQASSAADVVAGNAKVPEELGKTEDQQYYGRSVAYK
ncbi:hypothetical protein SELMODRAFT_412666 [Selaginella moellendorffii]|uniref:Uncharacterized protein n=1 Tax=Selaginella moellendorffii TaxID=88036 RepID=D8RM86_SELML|nr:hypothetical protein SELMODRAFT_412666 [Selaginella moellendorffii]